MEQTCCSTLFECSKFFFDKQAERYLNYKTEIKMNSTYHRFEDLFDQLGLPSDTCSIKFFIAQNSPLNNGIRLEDARCWTSSQATFLKEKIQLDANWADVVDQLNVAMRG